ncbi:uncharacterized protein B0H18DRAFT_1208172 [Fomitopsis serialis]|uniref:uncharacterized protein n=1 Tax=Fomitopsis serialis TaxID=139415 RepID=UPI002008C4B9|nr:uncharacterized protein B0H18DRAFT_1208172 [Neoantrodia serialis]KAH9933469.1 hypothetical protein B0H18DRAFT_1208172 [Neoantrodia serialis]
MSDTHPSSAMQSTDGKTSEIHEDGGVSQQACSDKKASGPSVGSRKHIDARPVDWGFWVIFFTSMGFFFGIIVLLIQAEREKVLSERFRPVGASASLGGEQHWRDALKQCEIERERWKAVAEEFRSLLVAECGIGKQGDAHGGPDRGLLTEGRLHDEF